MLDCGAYVTFLAMGRSRNPQSYLCPLGSYIPSSSWLVSQPSNRLVPAYLRCRLRWSEIHLCLLPHPLPHDQEVRLGADHDIHVEYVVVSQEKRFDTIPEIDDFGNTGKNVDGNQEGCMVGGDHFADGRSKHLVLAPLL
mgnify:CR=1 FL=1